MMPSKGHCRVSSRASVCVSDQLENRAEGWLVNPLVQVSVENQLKDVSYTTLCYTLNVAAAFANSLRYSCFL